MLTLFTNAVLDYGKATLTTWNSRILRQPTTSKGLHTTPLEYYIETNNVSTRNVLTIAVQMTCVIRYLHMCELVLEKTDMNDVIAVTDIDRQVSHILKHVTLLL